MVYGSCTVQKASHVSYQMLASAHLHSQTIHTRTTLLRNVTVCHQHTHYTHSLCQWKRRENQSIFLAKHAKQETAVHDGVKLGTC